MTKITLTNSKTRKLQKESADNPAIMRQLYRESVAREWLKFNGIPSWRNPSTPDENYPKKSSGRYSIMLEDGSRFLVCSFPDPILNSEMLASAKCFAVLSVKTANSYTSGTVMGFVSLKDLSQFPQKYNFLSGGLESNSAFLHYLSVSSKYFWKLLSFSIRLLLLGEPDAPEWGTEGAIAFDPNTGVSRRSLHDDRRK